MRPWQAAEWRGGELARQRADRAGLDAGRGRREFRREARQQRRQRREVPRVRLQGIRAHEALVEQHVQQREQQRRVAAGADEVVTVGELGRLAAARVDHHQPPAACAQFLQSAADIGHGHHAAVGGHGVVADQQQELRAVDVGHGLQELVPVHPQAHQVVRQLVGRGGGEMVARAEAFQEVVGVRHQSPVVHRGVAAVHADRVGAVALAHRLQPCGGDR
jgi:hypothetical protein